MEEVSKSVEDLSAKMDEMKQLFLQKIAHTEHEEQVVIRCMPNYKSISRTCIHN